MGRMQMILAVLGLIGCNEPGSAPPAGADSFTVAGPPRSIVRFEKVARDCGLSRLERKAKGDEDWLVIGGLPDDPPDEHPLWCALTWMYDHPNADLYAVGDAPAGVRTEWQVTLRLEAADLDALERAARACGFGPMTRHEAGRREWLSVEVPPAAKMACLQDWMDEHPVESAPAIPDAGATKGEVRR